MKNIVLLTLCALSFQTYAQLLKVETFISIREDPNHLGFYTYQKELPHLIIEAVENGLITPYYLNGKPIPIDDFKKRRAMDFDPYEDPYFGFGFGDEATEAAPTYYFDTDFDLISLTDSIIPQNRDVERLWLSLYLPADHPNNYDGTRQFLAKFSFNALQDHFKTTNYFWHHPINAGDSLNIIDALSYANAHYVPMEFQITDDAWETMTYKDWSGFDNNHIIWYTNHLPALDDQGYLTTSGPYYNRYSLSIIPGDPVQNSFTRRGNHLPKLLATQFMEGRLPGYKVDSQREKQQITTEEFTNRLEMYDESYFEEDDFFIDQGGFSNEKSSEEAKNANIIYYDYNDLSLQFNYTFEVSDFSGEKYKMTPKSVSLNIPASHPDNMTGIQKFLVEFDYKDVKQLLDHFDMMWNNPTSLENNLSMSAAIEQFAYPAFGIYAVDIFGQIMDPLDIKKDSTWYNWNTGKYITKAMVDSCSIPKNYNKGISNFKSILYPDNNQHLSQKETLSYRLVKPKNEEKYLPAIQKALLAKEFKCMNFLTYNTLNVDTEIFQGDSISLYLEDVVYTLDNESQAKTIAICLEKLETYYLEGDPVYEDIVIAIPLGELAKIPELEKPLKKWVKGKWKENVHRQFEALPYEEVEEIIEFGD